MQTYISILRGINLGGHNTIKMDDLKKILSTIGLQNIQTYIQSGNLIYQFKKIDTKKLDTLIGSKIIDQYGFEVPVITMTLNEMYLTVKGNPFVKNKAKDPAFFHITFLSDKPQTENVDKITAAKYSPNEFAIIDKAVYLYCPKGYGITKLSNKFLEKKLRVNATTRNWKTVNELLKIANTISNE